MNTNTLRFIINGGGVKINGGSFKDFEKLINGGQNKRGRGGGWGQNIKEKRQK